MGQNEFYTQEFLPKDDQQQNLFEDLKKDSGVYSVHHTNLPISDQSQGQENLHERYILRDGSTNKKLPVRVKKKGPRFATPEAFQTHHEKPNALSLIHDTHVSDPFGVFTVHSPSLWFCIHRCQTDIFTLVISVPWSIEAFPTGEQQSPICQRSTLEYLSFVCSNGRSRHFTISIRSEAVRNKQGWMRTNSIVFCTVSRHPYEFTVISNAE